MAVTKATGGYVITSTPLVRTGHTSHTSSLDRPVSDTALAAINTIQNTAWRVNTWLLDVLAEAFDKGHPVIRDSLLEGLSEADRALVSTGRQGTLHLPAIARLPDDVWAAMPEADRKPRIDALRARHGVRATLEGRQSALLDKLSVAQEMRGFERFYYPHALDFRGRCYPIPTSGPHPQADDIGKALIMFAEGLPLGSDGEFWLCVRAANCYGQDKLTLEERVGWALTNQESIQSCASSPFTCSWWTRADEPWSMLATCYELTQLWAMSPSESQGFVSHLPIPMDGSCNGLQTLSAMGRDPIGAAATNLCPGPRQDIYEMVAERVRVAVAADAEKGVPEAITWHGKVTRKVCKRSTMTTSYGVTPGGIRSQLVNDGHVPATGDERGPAASYMRDRLTDAIGETVQSGRAIMAWLQGTAKVLAEAGVAFDWSVPTGSRIRQAYTPHARRQVDTLCGALTIAEETVDGALDARKQALGSAPNFTHSMDAAHLALTVNAAHEAGINSFATIHDSFATHARNTTLLACVLREVFVEIHQTDWIRRVYEDVQEYAPHVKISPPPECGTFDIRQVLDSVFFFS